MTLSLGLSGTTNNQTLQNDPRDLWPLRHLIRVTKESTYLPTYPPTHLPTNLREHPKGAILETCDLCDIWDTDYNTSNWEHGLMAIFVIWQLIVTLDSIRNSCDVFCRNTSPCLLFMVMSIFFMVWSTQSNMKMIWSPSCIKMIKYPAWRWSPSCSRLDHCWICMELRSDFMHQTSPGWPPCKYDHDNGD